MSYQPSIVITGASAGIGLAALEALADDSFVVAISRTPPPLRHLNVRWLQGDLGTPETVATDLQKLLEAAGRPIDGLIHCAISYGADHRHAFLETRDTEWDEVMAVNVRSQFILTARLLPYLLSRPRAFIVSLSSEVATEPAPQRIAYGCSKAASHALFSGLAAELEASSVSVVQMMPEGQVVTRGIRRRRPPDFQFVGYSSPDVFTEPFKAILASMAVGMNGKCIVI